MNKRIKKQAAGRKAAASTLGGVVRVRFQCHAPTAQRVCVAGTFNDWQPEATPLQPQAHGLWMVELPLSPGADEYLFVVDGCWRQDHNATETTPNPFGELNAVVRVNAMR